MRKTSLGLTVIEMGDSIYMDGGSFLEQNPEIIDHLLRIGVLTHRHDAHPGLADPATAPTATVNPSGGSLPPATTVYVGYTLLDVDGGETRISPVAQPTTAGGLSAPAAPTAIADYGAGGLRPGVYRHAITVTDPAGGETLLGAAVDTIVDYGHANARVVLSGLTALVTAAGGAGWRLYRSFAGGQWTYLASGVGDAIIDDGTLCPDCSQRPPTSNSTNRASAIDVTVPALAAGTDRYRIYASLAPAFRSPSLVGEYAASDVTAKTISALTFAAGAPPAVSTSVGGADRIPAADISGLRWLTPVASAAALPVGTQGDVRLVLGPPLALYGHDGSDWQPISGGGGGGALGPLHVGDSIEWLTAGDAPAVQLTVTASTETSQFADDDFVTDGDYAPGWVSDQFKTASGYMLPADTSQLDTDVFNRLDPPGPTAYLARLDFEVVSDDWNVIGLIGGDGSGGGVEVALDRGLGAVVLRWRYAEADPWTVVASEPWTMPGAGTQASLSLDWDGAVADAYLLDAGGDPAMELTETIGPLSNAYAGVHGNWSQRDAVRFGRFTVTAHNVVYELTAALRQPDGALKSVLLADSR